MRAADHIGGDAMRRITISGSIVEMRRGTGDWWVPAEPVPDPSEGDIDYGYLIDDSDAPRPDPRSRRQPDGVHQRSRTYDPASFAWTDHAWTGRSKRSYTIVYQVGGAVGRVGEQDTAYGHRDAQYVVNINGISAEGDDFDEQVAWVRGYSAAMEPLASGVYVNVLGDEGEAGVRRAYPADKLNRLAGLKRQYDPDNVFHLNQNIRPS